MQRRWDVKLAYLKGTTAGAIVMFFCAASCLKGGDAGWTWRNPLPQGNHLHSVAWAGDQYIAVGNHGTVLTAPDGVEWTLEPPPVSNDLLAVTWTGDEALAIGDGALLLRSQDGVAWESSIVAPEGDNPDAFWLRTVTKTEDGTYLIVGSYGGAAVILRSTDGAEWNRVETVSLSDRSTFHDVVWTGERFVAVGEVAHFLYEGHIIRTSTDGIHWEASSFGDVGGLQAVIWTGEEIVAAGFVRGGRMRNGPPQEGFLLSSTDGLKWTKRFSTSHLLYDLALVDEQLMACGLFFVAPITRSGEEWSAEEKRVPYADHLWSIAGSGSEWVVVSNSGRTGYSLDGIGWQTAYRATPGSAQAVLFTGTEWIASGSGRNYLASPDGVNWFARSLPEALRWGWKAIWTGEYLFALGQRHLFRSEDSYSWTRRTPPPFRPSAAAWDGEKIWIAGHVSEEVLLAYTENGDDWHEVAVPGWPGVPQKMVWTGKELIVAGYFRERHQPAGSGKIFALRSPDGQEWEREVVMDLNLSVIDMQWNGRETVLWMGYRTAITGPGETWKVHQDVGLPDGVEGISWAGDRWLATGGRWRRGYIASSTDGFAWEEEFVSDRRMTASATAGGLTVAVGDVILTQGPVASSEPTFTREPATAFALTGSHQQVGFAVEFSGYPVPSVFWERSFDAGETWEAAEEASPAKFHPRLTLAADEMSNVLVRAVLTIGSGGNPLLFSNDASVQFLTSGEIVGSPELEFTMSGAGGWRLDPRDFYSDGMSLKLAGVSSGEDARMATEIEGPGKLTFWWRQGVTYRGLELARNGEAVLASGARSDWERQTLYLGHGRHELAWMLGTETGSGSSTGGAWFDGFSFQSGTLPDNEYDRWAVESLGEAGTPRSRPLAEFAKDGVSNLEYYASGMDALRPDWEKFPRARTITVGIDGETEHYLGLSFTRRADAGDLEYAVEASEDLENWARVPDENIVRWEANSDGTETITVADSVPMDEEETDRRFLRLRVKLLE